MPRLRPPTVRLRLTLLYGALFLVSGAALLAITYFLFQRSTGINFIVPSKGPVHLSPQELQSVETRYAGLEHAHADSLHQLLVGSGIALAIMTVLSIAAGWLVAGRVLRPLRTITATTRQISERNLNQRLALPGPRDELKDLADTVDALLARLEAAFGAQQRFVANAAHELRTPLTLWRALLEETLTDPDATIGSFRATSRRLLALGEEQERLLESLLTLASSERGLDRREPFDLAAIVESALDDPPPEAKTLGIQIDADLESAPAEGDAALAGRLVRNLIDNAVSHNVLGGHVEVKTGTESGRAYLEVTNDGPVIPPAEVDRLFEPFQRLAPDRTAPDDAHHGLGLSIVRAIATAHHATVRADARPEGGLAVRVNLPSRATERDGFAPVGR
ncbi:MAG TPA: ATP-binding protein [Solirubrobacterales bacterium]|nr:ATP-binding protein [Solirubrobacterales bacterium]